jgi:hypothetical protein
MIGNHLVPTIVYISHISPLEVIESQMVASLCHNHKTAYVVQPQVTLPVAYFYLSPICFYRSVIKMYESRYNLLLIRGLVKKLESGELKWPSLTLA